MSPPKAPSLLRFTNKTVKLPGRLINSTFESGEQTIREDAILTLRLFIFLFEFSCSKIE